MKSTKTIYWIMNILFALAMLMDAFGGITHQQAGIDVLKHLGYPEYLLTIAGVAKLFGIVAILQTKFIAIKEWAYAGFSFIFMLAFASRAFVKDGTVELIAPLIMLAYLLVVYYLWKKLLSKRDA
jgi:hypothetical protein